MKRPFLFKSYSIIYLPKVHVELLQSTVVEHERLFNRGPEQGSSIALEAGISRESCLAQGRQ